MKEFNKEEYNKLCAEFLKEMKYVLSKPNTDFGKYPTLEYMYKVDTSSFALPLNKELHSKINKFNVGEVSLPYMIDLNTLRFHSDWNWIMEVCTKLGMEFVSTDKEQLIQQIYDKLRNMETN